MVSFATGALDKQSAMKLVEPFMYSTVMSYGMVGNNNLCIRGVASTNDLLRIAWRGFWSVWRVNEAPYR